MANNGTGYLSVVTDISKSKFPLLNGKPLKASLGSNSNSERQNNRLLFTERAFIGNPCLKKPGDHTLPSKLNLNGE